MLTHDSIHMCYEFKFRILLLVLTKLTTNPIDYSQGNFKVKPTKETQYHKTI